MAKKKKIQVNFSQSYPQVGDQHETNAFLTSHQSQMRNPYSAGPHISKVKLLPSTYLVASIQ